MILTLDLNPELWAKILMNENIFLFEVFVLKSRNLKIEIKVYSHV